MKKYEAYKSTNIKWYPEIPKHWKVCKVKHIANTYAGGTPSTIKADYWNDGDIPWLPSGKLQNGEITTSEKFITEIGLNNSSTKWIKPKTVLIALTGATCANIGYLTFRACANQSVIAIDEIKEKSNSRFLYFMFLMMRKQVLTHQTGGAQAGINDNDVKNLYLVIPSLKEQTQIANYLDRKTQIIDGLIEKKEQLIKKLQAQRQAIINEAVTKGLNKNATLKNSGIEWLGEIPEHWSLIKMKNGCEFVFDGTHGSYNRVDNGYRLLSVRNIINDKFVFRDDDSCVSEKDYLQIALKFKIKEGDIQLAIVGATLGKSALVPKMLGNFVTQRSLATIRSNTNKLHNKFLYYFIKSESFQSYLWLNASFSAQPGVYLGTLQNCKIPFPFLKEQLVIVEYIDIEINTFERIRKKILLQVERLKSYRQAIISEAVTGKIDVRDWQAPKK
jgi:type I restriction enzyme S subunit